MKYWLLTSEYPPFHGGGISTYCDITANEMARTGIEVTVFVPDATVRSYQTTSANKNLTIVTFNPNYCKHDNILGYTANLSYSFAEIVKQYIAVAGEPDFIEAQDYLGIAYYLQQFKLTGLLSLHNTPIILTLHSPAFVYLEYNRMPTYRFPEFWTCEMEKAAIIAADILISPTHFLIEEIQKYLDLSSKEIHVIPNPFLPTDIGTPPVIQKNKIVFYGKLSAQKGSFKLLEYFDELWSKGFSHPLYIIGGTDIVYHPEYKTMQRIVEERYHRYIKSGLLKLEGKINPGKITETIGNAHVIVIPSIVDNLPYVVLESMARMKPVLTSVQGGQREIITDNETGFLFDHEEKGSFSQKLLDILSRSEDELNQISRKGYESLQRYHPEVVLPEKLQLLQRLQSGFSQKAIDYPFIHQEQFERKAPPPDKILSVIIPYFNMGKYINDCIKSVLESDYPHLEVIIVNDGSTEPDSLQKIEALHNKKGVKIIHQQNNGLAATRNTGAKAASGRFLAFLDADDMVSPSYFSKAIQLLEKYPNVFFVGCWTQYFENSSVTWPTFTPQPPYLLVHNPVNSSALVYERSAFIKMGLNDKTVSYGLEDYESVISLVKGGYNGVVIPEVHFYYRVRTNSMIRNIRKEKWLYSYKYIATKHADYYAKFATPVINLLNSNGPGYTYDNPTIEAVELYKFKNVRFLYRYLKRLVNKYPFLKKSVISFVHFTNLKK